MSRQKGTLVLSRAVRDVSFTIEAEEVWPGKDLTGTTWEFVKGATYPALSDTTYFSNTYLINDISSEYYTYYRSACLPCFHIYFTVQGSSGSTTYLYGLGTMLAWQNSTRSFPFYDTVYDNWTHVIIGGRSSAALKSNDEQSQYRTVHTSTTAVGDFYCHVSGNYSSLKITGGKDVENPDLINWLKANATIVDW